MKSLRLIALLGFFCVFLTGVSFAETISTAYLVTTSSSINDSVVHIINSSSEAQSFTGTLYNGDGTQLGASKVALHAGTVASQGRLILDARDLENLFNVPPWTGPAMLEVFGQDSLEVMIKLKSPSGLISNTNCVTEDTVRNIEGFDKSEDSYIRFINTSNSTITNITGSLYDNSGNLVGNPNQVLLSSLGPKEQVWLNRYAVWEKMGDVFWDGEASLVLDQEYPTLKLLMLNFVNSETFFNFSCFDNSYEKDGGFSSLTAGTYVSHIEGDLRPTTFVLNGDNTGLWSYGLEGGAITWDVSNDGVLTITFGVGEFEWYKLTSGDTLSGTVRVYFSKEPEANATWSKM